MLTRRIIPCLDVADGRVVKGVRFTGLRDAGDPVELSLRYQADGADELVILDVSATAEGRRACARTVGCVRRELAIPLTVGGGVRSIGDALLLLEAGADKVAVNTAAVERPELLEELAIRAGSQCVVLSLDGARRGDDGEGFEVVTHAGTRRTGMDVIEWAARAQRLGAGEILLTSWDQDGTREGYDTELVAAVTDAVSIPVIASGGADSCAHMAAAFEAGAHAVLAASIFHDRDQTVSGVKKKLAELGVEVRL